MFGIIGNVTSIFILSKLAAQSFFDSLLIALTSIDTIFIVFTVIDYSFARGIQLQKISPLLKGHWGKRWNFVSLQCSRGPGQRTALSGSTSSRSSPTPSTTCASAPRCSSPWWSRARDIWLSVIRSNIDKYLYQAQTSEGGCTIYQDSRWFKWIYFSIQGYWSTWYLSWYLVLV